MKKSEQIAQLKEQNQKLLRDIFRLKLENAIQRRALIELAKDLSRAEAEAEGEEDWLSKEAKEG